MEWKPIETAPLETDILVLHVGNDKMEIMYRPTNNPNSLYPGGASIGWYSHWMPLPPPPTGKK